MNKFILEKTDIKKIGHTAYNENGMLHIITETQTAHIEEMFLRNILRVINEKYYIVDSTDAMYENSIEFITNMPWDEFANM